jgi:predicted MFS family arabinose efflux permease
MSSGEVGTWLSMIVGIGGGIGNYLGGVLADRWAMSDARGRVWVPALAVGVAVPFGLLAFTTESRTAALALLIAPTLLGLMYQAPAFAVTQFLATPKMRATAAAVLLFVINIIGLALGPLATGAISDALEPRYGADSLRWALMIVSSLLIWSAFHFHRASLTLEADVQRATEAGRRAAQKIG